METSARDDRSAYLRCWGEYFHHSLKLTQAPASGLGHFAYRTTGPEALETAAEALQASGRGVGWLDGDEGHGRAYRFTTPAGHEAEIFWEVERFQAPPELRSVISSRAQKFITRGAAARRLSHTTLMAPDPREVREFLQETVGLTTTELVRVDGTDLELMVMMTANVTDHDLGISKDPFGIEPGRFNHVAFAYDTRGEIMRLADICYEYGHEMEFGPSRHGGSELYFFYVLEPGGNRVELCSGGYLFFEPDRPIFEHWVSEGGVVMWGNEFPPVMYGLGTPPVDPKTGKVVEPSTAEV